MDNKGRDGHNPNQPSDPVFRELRAALIQMVGEDKRTLRGLDGKQTPFSEFRMPIKAVQLVETLRDNFATVCSLEDVLRIADVYAFDKAEIDVDEPENGLYVCGSEGVK